MYNPSYDFELFEIPFFSPLQVGEYGASTRFLPSDPRGYANFNLNQLLSILNPASSAPFTQQQVPFPVYLDTPRDFFPRGLVQRFQDISEGGRILQGGQAPNPKVYDTTGGKSMCDEKSSWFERAFGLCCTFGVKDGQCTMATDSPDALGKEPTGSGEKMAKFLSALPDGSGVFIIGVAVIILLLLFARGR